MKYNTQREHLKISEYGRYLQQMVEHLMTLEDKTKRQKMAESIVEVMSILNAQTKNQEDIRQKFWDHLFVISDYKLDIESPYGNPSPEQKATKPEPLAYPKNRLKWSHLGKNFEKLLVKGQQEEDKEKQQGYVQTLGMFMKMAYKNWHNENVFEENIKDELFEITNGGFNYEPGEFKKHVDTTLIESKAVGNVKIQTLQSNLGYSSNRGRYNNNRNNNNNNNKYKNFKKR